MFEILFYKDIKGNELVKEYIDALNASASKD